MGSERTHSMYVMDDVGNNNRAKVAQEIAHISFTTLTRLDLASNRIESIEGLSRVEMPRIN